MKAGAYERAVAMLDSDISNRLPDGVILTQASAIKLKFHRRLNEFPICVAHLARFSGSTF